MLLIHMRHATPAWLKSAASKKSGLPDAGQHAAGRCFLVSRLFRSRPGADAAAIAAVLVEGVGPADVLLQFDRQRTDGPLGLMAGTRRAEFGRHASDG